MSEPGPGPEVAGSALLGGLGEAQRQALLQACVPRDCVAGETIFGAGALTPGLHFVESGAVEVLAASSCGSAAVPVATIHAGQTFGELSTLTGGQAVASVRAAATPTRLQVLSAAALQGLPDAAGITQVLMRNVIRIDQQRLAENHAGYVRQLQQTLALVEQRNTSARLLILVIVLMSITIVTNHWLSLTPGIDIYSPAFAWAGLLTVVLPTLMVAWRERYPLEAMGITTRHLGRDLACSLLIIAAVLGLGVAALWLAGYPLAERFRPDYLLRYGPLYALHSAVQEFMGRGVLLGMTLRVFDSGTWRQRQLSNLAVSLMFGVTHIHFGLHAVALSMVFSLLLGSYFMVYRNLAGPVLIHTTLGLAAFMLGLI